MRIGFASRGWAGRSRRSAAALVVVLALGAAWWVHDSRATADEGPTDPTATVVRGDFRTTVSASGTLVPEESTELSLSGSGDVTAVKVTAGDVVTEGDVLARMDPTVLQAQLEAAEATLDAAEAQLSEDISDGASDTRIAADRAQVRSAEASLEEAQAARDGAVLRAPFSGVVTSVGYQVGDAVGTSSGSGSSGTGGIGGGAAAAGSSTTGTSVGISLASAASYLVEATVDASALEQLEVGLQAEITTTGATATVYGIVAEVGRIATTDNSGAATYDLVIDVTGEPEGLFSGASAGVEIIVEQVTDVLAVQSQAIRTDDDGTTYVELVDGDSDDDSDGVTETPVEIGTTYGTQTEVLSGLAEGDVVRLATFTRGSGAGAGGQRGGGGMPEGLPDGFEPPSGGLPGGGQGGFPGGTP